MWVEERTKSLLLCLPLTGPKERGGIKWMGSDVENPDTWAHRGNHMWVSVFVCSSPVFCGPTTMNLGNLSQVFSLDQMSLCRLSSHGFCRGTDKELEIKVIIYMQGLQKHTRSYMQRIEDLLHKMNKWGYCYCGVIHTTVNKTLQIHISLNKGAF